MHQEINSLGMSRFMHANFGQLKARCACFPRKIHLRAYERFIDVHCYVQPPVCFFGNSVFTMQR